MLGNALGSVLTKAETEKVTARPTPPRNSCSRDSPQGLQLEGRGGASTHHPGSHGRHLVGCLSVPAPTEMMLVAARCPMLPALPSLWHAAVFRS